MAARVQDDDWAEEGEEAEYGEDNEFGQEDEAASAYADDAEVTEDARRMWWKLKSAPAARQTKGCDRSCVWSTAWLSDTLRWHELPPRGMP